jgi:hypothetical protein
LRRAAEMESYHHANSELLAIKRTPGWGLLAPVRRISANAATWANRRLIARSGLFDRDWYGTRYPEIDASALDPVLDYLQQGAAEGRDPSPLFLGRWYLEQYPDVRATGMNPLVHFLRCGGREGRNPSPLFETEWYRARYPDVRASGVNPLVHYVRHGAAEGRDPGPSFDTAWYLAEYPDVKALGFNPLAHYLQYGMAEGRRPNARAKGRQMAHDRNGQEPSRRSAPQPPKEMDSRTIISARSPCILGLHLPLTSANPRLVSVAKLVDFERGHVNYGDFIGITVLSRGGICERLSRHFRCWPTSARCSRVERRDKDGGLFHRVVMHYYG